LVFETENVEYEVDLGLTESIEDFLAIRSSFVDKSCDNSGGML
jgi:hypothetical protein